MSWRRGRQGRLGSSWLGDRCGRQIGGTDEWLAAAPPRVRRSRGFRRQNTGDLYSHPGSPGQAWSTIQTGSTSIPRPGFEEFFIRPRRISRGVGDDHGMSAAARVHSMRGQLNMAAPSCWLAALSKSLAARGGETSGSSALQAHESHCARTQHLWVPWPLRPIPPADALISQGHFGLKRSLVCCAPSRLIRGASLPSGRLLSGGGAL